MFLGGYDCILSESQDLGCYCSLVYSNLQRKTAALIISTSNNTHVILYTEKYSCYVICLLTALPQGSGYGYACGS